MDRRTALKAIAGTAASLGARRHVRSVAPAPITPGLQLYTVRSEMQKDVEATLARVAPGISEALIATAVGLASAIPALIAYNQYTLKVKHFKADMENFGSDFTNILKRNYLS